jgi:hypothetical protein
LIILVAPPANSEKAKVDVATDKQQTADSFYHALVAFIVFCATFLIINVCCYLALLRKFFKL